MQIGQLALRQFDGAAPAAMIRRGAKYTTGVGSAAALGCGPCQRLNIVAVAEIPVDLASSGSERVLWKDSELQGSPQGPCQRIVQYNQFFFLIA